MSIEAPGPALAEVFLKEARKADAAVILFSQ
jgi:hypothetical protein